MNHIYGCSCRWPDRLLTLVVHKPTQPSILLMSVNEDQLRLERLRQVWFIPFVDKRVGVQVKQWNPSTTRAVPERFCSAVPSLYQAYHFYLYHLPRSNEVSSTHWLTDDAAVLLVVLPTGQSTQPVLAGSAWYLPCGQARQLSEP